MSVKNRALRGASGRRINITMAHEKVIISEMINITYRIILAAIGTTGSEVYG
jgi:hypothetical protein